MDATHKQPWYLAFVPLQPLTGCERDMPATWSD